MIGELGVGTVTHSTLQMGLGLSGISAGIGLFALLAGFGLIWASKAKDGEFGFATATVPMAERLEETIS